MAKAQSRKDRARRAAPLLIIAAGSIGILAWTSCSSRPSSTDLLEHSVERTIEARSAAVSWSISLGPKIYFRADGHVDFTATHGELDLYIEDEVEPAGESILLEGKLYSRGEGQDGRWSEWVSRPGGASTFLGFSDGFPGMGSDEAAFPVDTARAALGSFVGDLDSYRHVGAARMNGDAFEHFSRSDEAPHGDIYVTDLYVDHDGRIRRMDFALAQSPSSYLTWFGRWEFSEFGTPVEVVPPQ